MNAQPETRETVAEFIARNGITLTAERIARRSDIPQDQWGKDDFHYNVVLRIGGCRELPTCYSMGSGNLRWKTREEAARSRYGTGPQAVANEGYRQEMARFWRPGEKVTFFLRETPAIRLLKEHLTVPVEPDAASVLDSLRLDAQSVEFSTFEDWCAECGYDTDSRKAEAIYRACQDGRAKLAGFLGRDLYAQLLECEPL